MYTPLGVAILYMEARLKRCELCGEDKPRRKVVNLLTSSNIGSRDKVLRNLRADDDLNDMINGIIRDTIIQLLISTLHNMHTTTTLSNCTAMVDPHPLLD